MKAIIYTLFLAVLCLLACGKDEKVEVPIEMQNNYTYENSTDKQSVQIMKAEYTFEDLFMANQITLRFIGQNNDNKVIFLLSGNSIINQVPEGNFSQSGGIVLVSGVIFTPKGNADYAVRNKNLKIVKEGNGYNIDFAFTTDKGQVKGSYKGTIVEK